MDDEAFLQQIAKAVFAAVDCGHTRQDVVFPFFGEVVEGVDGDLFAAGLDGDVDENVFGRLADGDGVERLVEGLCGLDDVVDGFERHTVADDNDAVVVGTAADPFGGAADGGDVVGSANGVQLVGGGFPGCVADVVAEGDPFHFALGGQFVDVLLELIDGLSGHTAGYVEQEQQTLRRGLMDAEVDVLFGAAGDGKMLVHQLLNEILYGVFAASHQVVDAAGAAGIGLYVGRGDVVCQRVVAERAGMRGRFGIGFGFERACRDEQLWLFAFSGGAADKRLEHFGDAELERGRGKC